MAKRSKRPVFDESDSDSDSTGSSFREYLNKKSEQSNKRARSSSALAAAKDGFQDESPKINRSEDESTSSTFISGLLESKRQREMDKLHSQSIRTRLENELQKTSSSNEESFITEGYKEKKKDYDNAEALVAEEENQDDDDVKKLYGGSTRGMALRILMSEQALPKDSQLSKDQERTGEGVVDKAPVFENDVYRAKDYKVSGSRSLNEVPQESSVKLRPEEKQLCIREFLKSTVSANDIEKHIKSYNKRHQQDS